ncbi:reverse transcriptase domain-containing protein [Tanacetum coccineum]
MIVENLFCGTYEMYGLLSFHLALFDEPCDGCDGLVICSCDGGGAGCERDGGECCEGDGYGGINPTSACANDTCSKGSHADRNKRFEVPTTFAVQKFESKLPSWLIGSSWAKEVIQEVHEGSCWFNAEPRSMVAKIMKQARMPNHDMSAVNNAWQFSYYGVNIVGPLPTTLEGLKILTIAIKPSLSGFGVPQTITSKEDKQFAEGFFLDFCKGLKIYQSFSPITEYMEIMNYIEKKLIRSQQAWVDDLPRILWVHRTLPRISKKETPFTLTYGSEAIIPKITHLTPEEEKSTTKERAEKRKDDDKEVALIEEAYYKSKLRKYHDTRARARPSTFGPGYFVLLACNNEGTQKQAGERPYIVNEAYENGLYKITSTSDYSVIRTMSGSKLRKFYV